MKNLLIFMFGVGVGVGGTMLYLHKMIKNELQNMQNQGNEKTENDEIPFEMKDKSNEKDSDEDKKEPVALRKDTKIEYNKLINSVEKGEKPPARIPVREPITDENGGYFVEHNDTDGGIYEIDKEEFINDKTYEKDRMVYYQDDRIMATEDGAIITSPAILVGGEWERCVGNYADRTAFIRNSRLVTDYEIYVEDGAYRDEYGPLSED